MQLTTTVTHKPDCKMRLCAVMLPILLWVFDGTAAARRLRTKPTPPVTVTDTIAADTMPTITFDDIVLPDSCPFRTYARIHLRDLREPIFSSYRIQPFPSEVLHAPVTRADSLLPVRGREWLDNALFVDSLVNALKQNYMIANPLLVRYNERMLPDPPKRYRAVIDPSRMQIVMMEELPTKSNDPTKVNVHVRPTHWLHSFNAALQMSQAYISPNWYQGGNNALSFIGNISYGVKLNQKFHPNHLLEASVSYKLAMSSTPDDSLRNVQITEDIFQITAKGGIKAFDHWFYSLSLNFKTQLFKSYPINSDQLSAAFLSPGELNLGLGMTYEYTSPSKKFNINASISSVSWNLKTVTNDGMDPASFGIDNGHRSQSQIGSSTEIKLGWQITRDISLQSRLFAFTQYDDSQLDWENTINFSINRFLSAMLYAHLRYDSTTPRIDDSNWHYWQFKEILSLGFSYKFSTI